MTFYHSSTSAVDSSAASLYFIFCMTNWAIHIFNCIVTPRKKRIITWYEVITSKMKKLLIRMNFMSMELMQISDLYISSKLLNHEYILFFMYRTLLFHIIDFDVASLSRKDRRDERENKKKHNRLSRARRHASFHSNSPSRNKKTAALIFMLFFFYMLLAFLIEKTVIHFVYANSVSCTHHRCDAIETKLVLLLNSCYKLRDASFTFFCISHHRKTITSSRETCLYSFLKKKKTKKAGAVNHKNVFLITKFKMMTKH